MFDAWNLMIDLYTQLVVWEAQCSDAVVVMVVVIPSDAFHVHPSRSHSTPNLFGLEGRNEGKETPHLPILYFTFRLC